MGDWRRRYSWRPVDGTCPLSPLCPAPPVNSIQFYNHPGTLYIVRVLYLCLIEGTRLEGDFTDVDDCHSGQVIEMAQCSVVEDDIATTFDDEMRHVVWHRLSTDWQCYFLFWQSKNKEIRNPKLYLATENKIIKYLKGFKMSTRRFFRFIFDWIRRFRVSHPQSVRPAFPPPAFSQPI